MKGGGGGVGYTQRLGDGRGRGGEHRCPGVSRAEVLRYLRVTPLSEIGYLPREQDETFVEHAAHLKRDDRDVRRRLLVVILKSYLLDLRLVDGLYLARKLFAHSMTVVRWIFGVNRSGRS